MRRIFRQRKEGGSLNLELAFIIILFVMVAVVGLTGLGTSVRDAVFIAANTIGPAVAGGGGGGTPVADSTPPTTLGTFDASTAGRVAVTLAGTDNSGGSGMTGGSAGTYYRVDGIGVAQTYTGPFDLVAVGSHFVEYWSVDKNGNEETPHSTSSSFTVVDVTPPSQVTGVMLTPGNGKITVSGYSATDNSGSIDHYVIWYNTSNTLTGATVINPAAAGSQDITGLANYTVYYVWVGCRDAAGNSGAKSDVQFLAPTLPPVTGFSATASNTESKIDLSWSSVSGATGYQYRYNTDGTDIFGTAVDAGSSPSFADSGLLDSTTYYYQVRATDGVHYAPWSATAQATTGHTVAAGNLTLTATAAGSVGYSGASGGLWSTTHDAASGTFAANGGATFNLGTKYATSKYYDYRAFLVFNTAGIPAEASPAADILIYSNNTAGNGSALVLTAGTQSIPLVTGDYTHFGATDFSPGAMYMAPVPNSPSGMPFNAAGVAAINRSGVTKLCLRTADDATNVTPVASTNPLVDGLTSAYPPVMHVTWSALYVAP